MVLNAGAWLRLLFVSTVYQFINLLEELKGDSLLPVLDGLVELVDCQFLFVAASHELISLRQERLNDNHG